MLGIRLLLVFSKCPQPDELVDTVLDAVAHAARPFCLRFALPLGMEYLRQALPQEAVGGVSLQETLLFYPEDQGLAGVLPLLTDETHFLALKGPHAFLEKWDQGLLSRLDKLPGQNVILTGHINAQEEGLPPQAYLPAFAEVFKENAVRIARGLPLVCAVAPVKTMVVEPGLIFGEVSFLRQAETQEELLSIAAFVAEYAVYALEKPLLQPLRRGGKRWLLMPSKDMLPTHYLARFEQFAGLSFEKRKVGVRSSLGLFATEDSYAQKASPSFLLAQQTKAILSRGRRLSLMLVTAFVDLPDASKPTLLYMLRFAFLRGLAQLPLLLYAGGNQERSLKLRFPNTLSYPDNSLLPRALLAEGMPPMQHFLRNKLPLLQRSMHAYLGFTHYAWVDFDILEHPICPQAMPDFTSLMDETVHLALVRGRPDSSFLLVPRQHLKLLTREVQALSQVDMAIKRNLSEEAMMIRLVEKFPDLFTLHPMPCRQLLFVMGFDPQLLSQEYRAVLADLPPPVKGRQWLGNREGGIEDERTNEVRQ